jgi:hypothetical protein
VLTVRCTLCAADAAVHDPVNPIFVPAPSLSAGLSALLASGKDADVTLLCAGERLAAHALLLCTRSPVFAAQLQEGPMQADASAVPVPAPDITPHTLHRLLELWPRARRLRRLRGWRRLAAIQLARARMCTRSCSASTHRERRMHERAR